MKKHLLSAVITFGVILALTACGGSTGTDEANDTADAQIENQANIQTEDQTDIQVENSIQAEDQTGTQEENEPEDQQVSESASDGNESENEEEMEEQTEMKMNVQVGDYTFTATLENNKAVEELLDMMKEGPVTISMSDYSGFEKVGSLGRSLTTSNSQTTTDAGDIVLYNGNNIVMFYGSNSWSYTRIGKIDDLSDWKKALGSGSITAVFTIEE